MKLKKYGAIGVMEWQLNLPVGKATVHVEFKGGFENKYGIHPATFMTTDPIVQTVIERSYYFASGKIKLLDVKDLGLSPMEIAAQNAQAEEAAKKKAEADAQAGNAQGQAIESPGTVASNAASEGATDDAEAELENETEEVAENEDAEENAVDGSVYDVEGETTSGVDMASNEGEYTVVQVTCNEDAKNYLVDNFNCSARKLTNWATILEVGKANGILFEK